MFPLSKYQMINTVLFYWIERMCILYPKNKDWSQLLAARFTLASLYISDPYVPDSSPSLFNQSAFDTKGLHCSDIFLPSCRLTKKKFVYNKIQEKNNLLDSFEVS